MFRRALGVFTSFLLFPILIGFLLFLSVYNTILNPNFYTEERLQNFYTPASSVLFESASKNVVGLDNFMLESEFQEIFIKSFPVSNLANLFSETAEKIRNIDLLNANEGIELDLEFLREGLATFVVNLSNSLDDRMNFTDKDVQQLEFALQKKIPKTITIFQIDAELSANQIIDKFTLKNVFLIFVYIVLVLALLMLLLLMPNLKFLGIFIGIWGICISIVLWVLKSFMLSGFKSVILADATFNDFPFVIMDFVNSIFAPLGLYALYIFIVSIILLLISAHLHKFTHVT